MATKTRSKTRFNMIDLIIIIVVIVCVIGTVFRAAILDKLSFSAGNDTVYVSFYAENLSSEELASIHEGDKLSLGGEYFGTLKNFESQAQNVVVALEDGTFDTAVDNSLFTLIGEIEIKGKNTDEGFFFDSDVHIGVGKMLKLSGEKCNISIVITKITEKEA